MLFHNVLSPLIS